MRNYPELINDRSLIHINVLLLGCINGIIVVMLLLGKGVQLYMSVFCRIIDYTRDPFYSFLSSVLILVLWDGRFLRICIVQLYTLLWFAEPNVVCCRGLTVRKLKNTAIDSSALTLYMTSLLCSIYLLTASCSRRFELSSGFSYLIQFIFYFPRCSASWENGF